MENINNNSKSINQDKITISSITDLLKIPIYISKLLYYIPMEIQLEELEFIIYAYLLLQI